MLETLIVGAIVAGAGVWFVLWLRGTANGEKGCSCGSCTKECAGRKEQA